jgi:hypothetical protein
MPASYGRLLLRARTGDSVAKLLNEGCGAKDRGEYRQFFSADFLISIKLNDLHK